MAEAARNNGGNNGNGRARSYTTELDGIRAPLGVILYLIRRDNLDIYDIPIAKITKEYLDYLNMMEEMQIELAGEFFVLAATLMRIKAQMLLRHGDEGDEDPREGLVRSLLEYKKMVEAARAFRELEEERSRVFTRPVPDAEKEYREEPEFDVSLFQLMRAFQEVMVQFEAADVREIELEEYTIEDRITVLQEALAGRDQVLFTDLFAGGGTRLEMVVTLMALLELIKHGHVKIRQEGIFGTIWLYRGESFGQPLDPVVDWGDEANGAENVATDGPPTADTGAGPAPETAGAPDAPDAMGEDDERTRAR